SGHVPGVEGARAARERRARPRPVQPAARERGAARSCEHHRGDPSGAGRGAGGRLMASLSRQLAQWVARLRYADLPPAVGDRAKGLTLQGLASALIGSTTPDGRQAVTLITDEEAGVTKGATILVHGTRVTKGGAAFANSEMVFAGGKWDTFRMLTHPGTSII